MIASSASKPQLTSTTWWRGYSALSLLVLLSIVVAVISFLVGRFTIPFFTVLGSIDWAWCWVFGVT